MLDGSGTLGVAVSGGGDSVALLYALAEWGRRPLHVYCVDHRLNPLSAQWTQGVAGHAARLGAAFTALAWDGVKPESGLSAAARQARHALLADAARANGVSVMCLAHTADDVAEAQAMRTQGSNVGTPRPWSPSPVWPQGRGIVLCRPFLGHSRAALRIYLRGRGIDWIDDPANESETSLRARTRKALAGRGGRNGAQDETPTNALRPSQIAALMFDPEGWAELGLLRFRAEALMALPRDLALKIVAAAAVCAGGGNRLPRLNSVAVLLDQIAGERRYTLCGARLWQQDGVVHAVREGGDIGRNPNAQHRSVWDGRFELSVDARDAVPSGRARSRLGDSDRRFLAALPGCLRLVLPVIPTEAGPVLAHSLREALRSSLYDTVTGWVLPRFLRTVCQVEKETDL